MALTYSGYEYSQHGHQRTTRGLISFDRAYPKRGYEVTPHQLGLGIVDTVEFPGNVLGRSFAYDLQTQRLHVRRPGSVMAIEATGLLPIGEPYLLSMLPAYILGIRGTAGSIGTKRLIPTGKTPGTGQCSIDFSTGAVRWGDAGLTEAVIMYIPLGVPGFTSDLLVVDEPVTITDIGGGCGAGTLAHRAACLTYVWNHEDEEVLAYQPVGEKPGANQVDIDLLSPDDTTILRVLSSDIGYGAGKLLATYIAYQAGVHGEVLRWGDQADIPIASNVVRPGADGSLVLPGLGQCVVGELSDSRNAMAFFVDPGAAPGNGLLVLDPATNTWTGNGNPAFTRVELPLLYVPAAVGAGVSLDVPCGEDVSGLINVPFVAVGS